MPRGGGSADAPDVGSPVLHDQLIEQGIPPLEANRLAVRQSLQVALEIGFERWGRLWMCAVVLLLFGMLGVLVWSQWVYDSHHNDKCDQPMAMMLRLLYFLVALHAFQREIVQHILCYSSRRDGPVEPCRVVFFRRAYSSATLLWPIAGSLMLLRAHHCSAALQSAVRVITLYYAVFALVALVLPACFVTVMLVLVQRGLVRVPRSQHAAPDDLIDRLPKVAFDPELFSDGQPGCYPSACPICLDSFGTERQITSTPCAAGRHAFHTECLQGWLRCARTCPLCREDLAVGMADDPEAGIELTA